MVRHIDPGYSDKHASQRCHPLPTFAPKIISHDTTRHVPTTRDDQRLSLNYIANLYEPTARQFKCKKCRNKLGHEIMP